jgi:hypothetical protein
MPRKPVLPVFASVGRLAKRSDLHRESILRLLVGGQLTPDALLDLGTGRPPQPLFRLERSPAPRPAPKLSKLT